jgi:hypothetical protein
VNPFPATTAVFSWVPLCIGLAGLQPVRADWRDEVGYTRLNQLSAADLPSAPSDGLAQIESSTTPNSPYTFLPDPQNPLFAGKTFTNLSATSGTAISGHATHVAENFFGNTSSLLTGNCAVDNYYTIDWLYGKFLKTATNDLPLVQPRAVENHSWVAASGSFSSNDAEEINQRLDYAINRDGFVCVVGSDNENSSNLPQLLSQSYHTISVGRDDGGHSAGLTNFDTAGRIKPDLVAPSAAPEYATSWTTPMVASAAALLYSKLAAAPYSLTGADQPRVIKALLMASAVKSPSWTNTSTRPLDAEYGAGILNVYHAYQALRSGRVSASNNTTLKARGWAAETVNASATKTYHFTIAPGATSTPFSAALTWHRAVSKSRFGNWSATLADLDLKIYQTNGFTLGVNLASSLSSVDNVELIHQAALPAGTYALVVQNQSNTATPYALAWHSLPGVSLAVTQPLAKEIDAQAAMIQVTRTGDTTLPLFVPLSYGGTAVAGEDFLALPASLTIPAGQSTATLQIYPISDQAAQGDRSLILSAAADFGFVRDSTQVAGLTIQDKPFDAWRFTHFTNTELLDPTLSAEIADPDGDSLANLMEYALALNPRVAGSLPPMVSQTSNYLTLSVAKNPSAIDLLWNAEVSGNLIDWQNAFTLTNTNSVFTARDPQTIGTEDRRFIRLKVTRAP